MDPRPRRFHRGGDRRDRESDEPRRHRVHHMHGGLHRRRHPRGRRQAEPLGALRHDFFRPGRHGPVLPGHPGLRHHHRRYQAPRRNLQASRLRVPEYAVCGPYPRHSCRTHDLRHEVRQLGLGFEARPHPHGGGPRCGRHWRYLRRGGHLLFHRPLRGAVRLREAGAHPRPAVHPGARPRPSRPGDGGPRRDGLHPGIHRHAGAPASAVRRHRGGRAVHQGPEGLFGHAPQAQPHHGRARVRPRPRGEGERPGGLRQRGPVVRARHLAFRRRARGAGRQLHGVGLHVR